MQSTKTDERAAACERFRSMPGLRTYYEVNGEVGRARLVWEKSDGMRWYMFPDGSKGEPRSGTRVAEPQAPDLSDPATQGCVIELIARNNPRRSKSDALHALAYAMGQGLSIEEALVQELERCTEDS